MTALSVSHEDQERLKDLLSEAVTVLCRNGLKYLEHVTIDGLLGITVDSSDVFLVKLTETVNKSDGGPDLTRVSKLLGAAQCNLGVLNKVAADGSTPIDAFTLGAKDLNDNHQPAAINIMPILSSDMSEALAAARRGGKRRHSSHSTETTQSKHPYVVEPLPSTSASSIAPTTTTTTTPVASSSWQMHKDTDIDNNLVIKSEPMDSDEEVAPQHQYKTLGVISAVPMKEYQSDENTENGDSQDGLPDVQPTGQQDGVLKALRAALIQKLANNGTPVLKQPPNNNNNNESPCSTPTSSNSNSSKKRKVAPKTEKEDEAVTLKCLMCTYETNRRYNFIRHMRGHSKSYAIYACDLCGDRFHSEDELGAHGLDAHKGHHLTCDQCGMTFMSERGKNIHAKTHKMMPIPEKTTVECETQCSTNDLEMSMTSINSASDQKVISASIPHMDDSDETPASYRTLREQLSSGNLVLHFPVLNGKKTNTTSTGVGIGVGVGCSNDIDSENKDEQPNDLSMSKTCSTSTSPPQPVLDKPLNLRIKNATIVSYTSTETHAATTGTATPETKSVLKPSSTSSTSTSKLNSSTTKTSTSTSSGSMTLLTKPAPFPSFTTSTKPVPFPSSTTCTKPVSLLSLAPLCTSTSDKPQPTPFTITMAKHQTPAVVTRPSSYTTARPLPSVTTVSTAGAKQIVQTIVKPGITITTSKPVIAGKTTQGAPSLYTSILPRLIAPLAASVGATPATISTTTPTTTTSSASSPASSSGSPTPDGAPQKPKEKSRKQKSAQIIRHMHVMKPEPMDT